VLIHFLGVRGSERTLTPEKSRALLEFCRSCGVTLFTVNFLYVKGNENNERVMEAFYEKLLPFSAAQKVLECIGGSGFREQPCWTLNDSSIELILRETSGDLFAYDILNQPEDWLFYRVDSILLQIVSHEQEAILRVSADEYERFQKLRIPHSSGLPRWSALPEQPSRAQLL
jgi:hypothetical protein